MFTPDASPCPIHLEYIDVYRFSHTNVSGFERVVDCWLSDDDQQVPGPWVGQTCFITRLPPPKPGWAIQSGIPTNFEANTARPEHVGVETWKV